VRRREINGVAECETAFYLLSTPLSPTRFAEVARPIWGIENRLHWVLDVTMNEDQSRARMDHAPHNLALLRRWALNACKLEGSKGSMEGKLEHDRFRLKRSPRR
jgi:predicted transposase YbfD/YdcC